MARKNSFGANTMGQTYGRGPGPSGAARSVQSGPGAMAKKVTPHNSATRATPNGKALRTKPYDRGA